MTSSTVVSHIDEIQKAEQKSASMIADAQNRRIEAIANAKTEVNSKIEEYADAVRQVEEKRFVTQEQDLDQKTTQIIKEAQAQASQISQDTVARRDSALKEVIVKIIGA